ATMFFRDQIVESAIMLPETTRGRTTTNRRLLRRINTFLNTIQLAITEAYER
ncbi:MAG: DNA-binding protein, partial [Bacteroidetes bacterium]